MRKQSYLLFQGLTPLETVVKPDRLRDDRSLGGDETLRGYGAASLSLLGHVVIPGGWISILPIPVICGP